MSNWVKFYNSEAKLKKNKKIVTVANKENYKHFWPREFFWLQKMFLLHGYKVYWKRCRRWELVSLVLLLISCFFFLGLGLLGTPWTCAMALLFAVFVAGFIPFFWRSFSISSMSRGNSIPRNNSFKSSSTLMGTLGSLGKAMSSWESKFDSSQIWPAALSAYKKCCYQL